jgi:hypothetical protein
MNLIRRQKEVNELKEATNIHPNKFKDDTKQINEKKKTIHDMKGNLIIIQNVSKIKPNGNCGNKNLKCRFSLICGI